MGRDGSVFLQHILDAIARIEEYLLGISEQTFWRQYLVQDSVIRQFEIIGEASKRLSTGVRAQCPIIPWQAVVRWRMPIHGNSATGMRHSPMVELNTWSTLEQVISVMR